MNPCENLPGKKILVPVNYITYLSSKFKKDLNPRILHKLSLPRKVSQQGGREMLDDSFYEVNIPDVQKSDKGHYKKKERKKIYRQFPKMALSI